MVLDVEFSSFDRGEDGEHIDVGFVKISSTSVTEVKFFHGTESFDRVYNFYS